MEVWKEKEKYKEMRNFKVKERRWKEKSNGSD
jgi:hypothetical protein